jgi:hypothetical protein
VGQGFGVLQFKRRIDGDAVGAPRKQNSSIFRRWFPIRVGRQDKKSRTSLGMSGSASVTFERFLRPTKPIFFNCVELCESDGESGKK